MTQEHAKLTRAERLEFEALRRQSGAFGRIHRHAVDGSDPPHVQARPPRLSKNMLEPLGTSVEVDHIASHRAPPVGREALSAVAVHSSCTSCAALRS